MKGNKILAALVIAFISSSAMAADVTVKANLAVNSTLVATCSLAATSINFGAIMLPLSSQSTGGSINLLCSKQAPYTIDLAYGGVYGQGQKSGDYWVLSSPNAYYSEGPHTYAKYSTEGVFLEIKYVKEYTSNTGNIGRILGCTFNGNQCSTARTAYDYGIMSGVEKGDRIAYAIYIPGDTSKIWNAGKNSYSGFGTGKEEQINFQAKIIAAQSASSYPAPDFYMDTVTATVKY